MWLEVFGFLYYYSDPKVYFDNIPSRFYCLGHLFVILYQLLII